MSFTVKGKCPYCGETGLTVSAVPASRVIFKRVLKEGVKWGSYCPWCQKNSFIRSSQLKKLALDSGQYAAFKRVQPNNGYINAFAAFICVLIVSTIVFVEILVSQSVVYSSDVESSKLGYGKQFAGENLTLLECYGSNSKDDWNGDWDDTEKILALHMLAFLENENGMFFIPVNVDPTDDIFMPCVEYLKSGGKGEPVVSNIHGYIDRIPGDSLQLITERLQPYEKYIPGIVIVKNEILYWDNNAVPTHDIKDMRLMQIVIGTVGLAAIICLALDIYVNSNFYNEKKQNRYDQKN